MSTVSVCDACVQLKLIHRYYLNQAATNIINTTLDTIDLESKHNVI